MCPGALGYKWEYSVIYIPYIQTLAYISHKRHVPINTTVRHKETGHATLTTTT
jgi:hypothetical protein